jgi:hypothetical protein
METILIAIGIQILGSISSGITWDAIKLGAQTSIDKFKKAFTKKDYFKDERQAEAFLEKICTAEPYNKANPYGDASNIYSGMTGNVADDNFKHELEAWIVENKDELFKKASMIGNGNINVYNPVARDNAEMTIIGNQHNY